MTIKVKDAARSASKWVRNSVGAVQDYRDGVADAEPWAAHTIRAKDNYAQGVQAAIGRGAFEKGVAKAGDDKWKRGAEGLGADRYASGITAKEDAYRVGVEPYLAITSSFSLPKRGPRGSAENHARSQALGQALHRKRVGGSGSA